MPEGVAQEPKTASPSRSQMVTPERIRELFQTKNGPEISNIDFQTGKATDEDVEFNEEEHPKGHALKGDSQSPLFHEAASESSSPTTPSRRAPTKLALRSRNPP
jgi:hypothetical protein